MRGSTPTEVLGIPRDSPSNLESSMLTLQLSNVVWQEDAYFVAKYLNVDVSSFGESREETLSNLHEALESYFEDISAEEIAQVQQPEVLIDTMTNDKFFIQPTIESHDSFFLLAGIISIIFGVWVMSKNKFWHYWREEGMSYVPKFRLYLDGMLFILLGVCILIDQLIKILK